MLISHKLCLSHDNVPVLNQLSLTVKPGTLTVLLGRNGAGKSTVLKALAGDFQRAVPRNIRLSGATHLNGIEISAIAAPQLARLRAVLPQSSPPAFPFSAEEIVLLGRYPHGKSASDRTIAAQALALAGANTLATRSITTLSGGELARVQFARVLAQLWPANATRSSGEYPASPRYLLLDEPTAALDLAHQHRLLTTVKRLTRKWHIGALAIVHDPNLAARYADAIALLAHGAIIAQGPPAEIMQTDLIERCYGFAVRLLDAGENCVPLVVAA